MRRAGRGYAVSRPSPRVAAGPRPPRLPVNAAAAFLATAAQTLFVLATYAYLVRVVGAEAVGLWVSLVAAGMLACVADLGLSHALIWQLALAMRDGTPATAEQPLAAVETIVTTVAAATGVALLLAWASFPWWGGWVSTAATTAQAHAWLVFVLVGLWLNRVADALAGALDGQQRFVERSLVSAAALLCGLLLAIAVAPRWGMDGFALVFVLQYALQLAGFALLLRRPGPGPRWWRPRLRRSVLRDALRYGLSVQVLVMCYLVIESAVKLALAGRGSLAEVAYFDLAFRIGKGVRGLLASALRVLVPRLASEASAANQAVQRDRAYATSFAVLLLFALPIYAGIVAAAQPLSQLLVGRSEPAFAAALAASLAAWAGYNLTDPALNLSLASGRMRWPVHGHLLALALVLGVVFMDEPQAPATGGLGIYAQLTLAILAGCSATLIGIHRSERAAWSLLGPLPTLAALAGAAVVGALGPALPALLPDWPAATHWAVAGSAWAGYTVALWWLSPAGREVRGALLAGIARKASTRRPASAG